MEVSSTALILLLTLVAPLRNWLRSAKSSKRLKVFNFNLEYETFFELMHPKLFKNFPFIKRKRIVLWTDFLIFSLRRFNFHFRTQYFGCPITTLSTVTIFSYRVLSCLCLKNTIFNVESLVQQSVNATSSPSATRKQLLLVLNCNSHLSCPFV